MIVRATDLAACVRGNGVEGTSGLGGVLSLLARVGPCGSVLRAAPCVALSRAGGEVPTIRRRRGVRVEGLGAPSISTPSVVAGVVVSSIRTSSAETSTSIPISSPLCPTSAEPPIPSIPLCTHTELLGLVVPPLLYWSRLLLRRART